MNLKNLLICTAAVLSMLLVGLPAQAARYRIVVNNENPVDSLTEKELSRIFLKKNTKWEGGGEIMPVDLPRDSSVRERFSEDIHGKSVSSVQAYWQKLIFSGRGVPPPEKPSSVEARDYVKEHEGGIAYISTAVSTAGVKVISVED